MTYRCRSCRPRTHAAAGRHAEDQRALVLPTRHESRAVPDLSSSCSRSSLQSARSTTAMSLRVEGVVETCSDTRTNCGERTFTVFDDSTTARSCDSIPELCCAPPHERSQCTSLGTVRITRRVPQSSARSRQLDTEERDPLKTGSSHPTLEIPVADAVRRTLRPGRHAVTVSRRETGPGRSRGCGRTPKRTEVQAPQHTLDELPLPYAGKGVGRPYSHAGFALKNSLISDNSWDRAASHRLRFDLWVRSGRVSPRDEAAPRSGAAFSMGAKPP